ncbi:hypothetical protein N7478_004685 [Penicillium angulare]|uniref:uncharacterized protein n=1 Tax=Penicillium angulare TaxID=116970 RepID=UPI00253F7830|nr:uncharacterized protein N7478_004685 [Penicillium angulare]KAJ5279313.1 hypothetical protein N7478_004685 [Penicillium angulare]
MSATIHTADPTPRKPDGNKEPWKSPSSFGRTVRQGGQCLWGTAGSDSSAPGTRTPEAVEEAWAAVDGNFPCQPLATGNGEINAGGVFPGTTPSPRHRSPGSSGGVLAMGEVSTFVLGAGRSLPRAAGREGW